MHHARNNSYIQQEDRRFDNRKRRRPSMNEEQNPLLQQ